MLWHAGWQVSAQSRETIIAQLLILIDYQLFFIVAIPLPVQATLFVNDL
jgi:hypothetical protein